MRVLDLFCGGGGAALGLLEAGFDEVVGIDREKKHAKVYPGRFVCADVATLEPGVCKGFDLVWASPPCQRFSPSTKGWNHSELWKSHPDLIPKTRAILAGADGLHVIENVPNSPLRRDLQLTGPMVGLHRIQRRRVFELSWFVLQPPLRFVAKELWQRGEAVTITKSMCAPNHYYARQKVGKRGRVPVEEAREVMGISTPMTTHQIGEAVAPPMARYIGELARIELLSRAQK